MAITPYPKIQIGTMLSEATLPGAKATWKSRKQETEGEHLSFTFEYKFADRYNWDKGKTVPLLGSFSRLIWPNGSDIFMGDFHLMGLAKEYSMRGSFVKVLNWTSRFDETVVPAIPQPTTPTRLCPVSTVPRK